MLTRRKFLSGLGGLAAGSALPLQSSPILQNVPKAQSELGKVKIVDIKTASVQLTYYAAHLVKITTDAGLVGLGEAYRGPGTLDWINAMKEYIVGKDPLQVDFLFERMMEAGSGADARSGTLTGAIAGIETALWDLAGKILNVPVYTLLGGKFRDKIPLYHDSGAPRSEDPKDWIESARASRDRYGFKAIKFDLEPFRGERWNRGLAAPDIKTWMRILEAVRAELGPDFPFSVDLHWKYNPVDVLSFLKAAEPLDLWYVEDPIPPENADALARLKAESRVPICTGENLYSRHTWRPFIEKQACDIIQPDPQKSGGLLETKRIANWAELYYMPMACHNLCSPVGTMAAAHACASIRSFIALESDSVELPHWQDIVLRDGPFYKDGCLELTAKPGLGIELNEDVCRKHLAPGSSFFQ
jgi:L-alanine-DL-glutamate epimerase-like enolase superfamily enzyme